MPGGTHLATLSNGQKLPVSRLQSRFLRERLLKLGTVAGTKRVRPTYIPVRPTHVSRRPRTRVDFPQTNRKESHEKGRC